MKFTQLLLLTAVSIAVSGAVIAAAAYFLKALVEATCT